MTMLDPMDPNVKTRPQHATDELAPMQEDPRVNGAELAARDVVFRASQETITLLLAGMTPGNTTHTLLQIERTVKCFRAATLHLGQPSYPEDVGRRKGRGMGGAYRDRETMGIAAMKQVLGLLTSNELPKKIEHYLAGAQAARASGMLDVAARLEAEVRSLTAQIGQPSAEAAGVTQAVREVADAAEKGVTTQTSSDIDGYGFNAALGLQTDTDIEDLEDDEQGGVFYSRKRRGGTDDVDAILQSVEQVGTEGDSNIGFAGGSVVMSSDGPYYGEEG